MWKLRFRKNLNLPKLFSKTYGKDLNKQKEKYSKTKISNYVLSATKGILKFLLMKRINARKKIRHPEKVK